jgi:hypothetical protein
MAAAHGKIKKKYGMENERDALFTAVDVSNWESHVETVQIQIFFIGDIAVGIAQSSRISKKVAQSEIDQITSNFLQHSM